MVCGNTFVIDNEDTEGDLANVAGCTVVTGNIEIFYTTITNLEGLESVNRINGDLIIVGNHSLMNLQGLNNLRYIINNFSSVYTNFLQLEP